jgi:threonine dehydrogenase-like Zn-dependent dehydrogenase
MAKDMGAHKVIVMDRLENRLQLAREFGADETINIEDEAWSTRELRRKSMFELTGRRGADIVMDLAGRPELLVEGVDYLSPGGTFVEIGHIAPGNPVLFDATAILRGKRIIGSAMYRPSLIPLLLETLVKKQGKVPYDKIVSHWYPLAEVNKAFEEAEWLERQTPVTRSMLRP